MPGTSSLPGVHSPGTAGPPPAPSAAPGGPGSGLRGPARPRRAQVRLASPSLGLETVLLTLWMKEAVPEGLSRDGGGVRGWRFKRAVSPGQGLGRRHPDQPLIVPADRGLCPGLDSTCQGQSHRSQLPCSDVCSLVPKHQDKAGDAPTRRSSSNSPCLGFLLCHTRIMVPVRLTSRGRWVPKHSVTVTCFMGLGHTGEGLVNKPSTVGRNVSCRTSETG